MQLGQGFSEEILAVLELFAVADRHLAYRIDFRSISVSHSPVPRKSNV
jgi:hypothetical protein